MNRKDHFELCIMDEKTLLRIALRQKAVYLNNGSTPGTPYQPTAELLAFTARLRGNGYVLSEELLHALAHASTQQLESITDTIDEVLGIKLNWMPLVKGWNVPTGESAIYHFLTWVANSLPEGISVEGTRLPCGHLIPDGTFPLERYNGCPFCGMPFKTADFVYTGQGSKLQELRLFTDTDMQHLLASLLNSPTPLDATQKDSLQLLLSVYPLPENVNIKMKETTMMVVDALLALGDEQAAAAYMRTPADVLRYLWYKKTGLVQIIEPKTLIEHERRLNTHIWMVEDKSEEAAASKREGLKLKYDRTWCRRVARWLNDLPMSHAQACENMNPKRGLWVRMIHALRLGEYSRKQGYKKLHDLLDMFYKQNYTTWQGCVDKARQDNDADTTLTLLQQRPGLFARALFATMLRFGTDKTLKAFMQVTDTLPARLLLSLGNAAELYFAPNGTRLVRPLTGGQKAIEPHPLVKTKSAQACAEIVKQVHELYANAMRRKFATSKTGDEPSSMFIDPSLYDIPVSVGDRATTTQDTACALTGTRFPVEGGEVRLFMQWGQGLPAQPLDMDLSCRIVFTGRKPVECAYFNLTAPGAKHSGDIRHIPDQVGTAEYIQLSLPELTEAGAQYVIFTCNAYSEGAIAANLMVGWMNSANPMRLSEETGVAYDPSCVQHLVRISENNLSKGLVFGMLDVDAREIIWLEMPFIGQNIESMDTRAAEALLRRLRNKLSIGKLLEIKAEAQGITLKPADEAEICYTYEWALNPAEVAALLG